MRTLLALAAVSALAGCSSTNTTPPPPLPSAQPSSTRPATTASGPAELGTMRTGSADGVSVATGVFHVRVLHTRAEFGLPSEKYLGADVRLCITKADQVVDVSFIAWQIVNADETTSDPEISFSTDAFSVPLYPMDRRMTAGECARGWIMFKPGSSTPVRVTYAGGTMTPMSWRIPKGVA